MKVQYLDLISLERQNLVLAKFSNSKSFGRKNTFSWTIVLNIFFGDNQKPKHIKDKVQLLTSQEAFDFKNFSLFCLLMFELLILEKVFGD